MGQRYKIYPKYLFIFPNICTSELRPKVLSFEKNKKNSLFSWLFAHLFVPLHPLFGVTDGGK